MGRYIARVKEAAHATIEDTVQEGAEIAAAHAPKRTGRLADSILPVVFSRTQGAWVAKAPYASYQEYGTSAHEMWGNPYFAFFWDEEGRWWVPGLFGEPDVIHHPGNPAHPFMEPSQAVMSRKIMAIARRHYPG
jgi:hypothetical protein